jgi:hypothetical protein
MNQYQRIGTFIIRLVGALFMLVGALGMLYALAVKVGLVAEIPSRPSSSAMSIVWLVGGAAFILLCKPIGRWLGHGLE